MTHQRDRKEAPGLTTQTRMLGFDISNKPHPQAAALVSPLISGGAFVAGVCFFRSDIAAKFLSTPNVGQSLKVFVLVVLSYAAGYLLSAVVSTPLTLLCYFAGCVFGYLVARAVHKANGDPVDASKRPAWRRAVVAIFGSYGLAPRSAEDNANEFLEILVPRVFQARESQADRAEAAQQTLQDIRAVKEQLRVEAIKLFTITHDEQWAEIHRALLTLPTKRAEREGEILTYTEAAVAIAAGIVAWTWLGFSVPRLLLSAAKIEFIVAGVGIFLLGAAAGQDQLDGASMQGWLFQEILNRRP